MALRGIIHNEVDTISHGVVMYRILIVDDESAIRKKIKSSMNWNEFGFEMVEEASNGLEALSQIMENKPDLILLDINMPGMDGLEFAGIVKKQFPRTRVVIITGYDHFSYAREALRLGVDNYILKPTTKEDIRKIVLNQLAKIEEERKTDVPQLPQNEKKVKTYLLNDILKNGTFTHQKSNDFLELQGWSKAANIFYVILRDFVEDVEFWRGEHTAALAEFALLNITEEIVEAHSSGFAFPNYKNEISILLNCNRAEAEEILEEIRDSIMDFLGIPVDFAVSAVGKTQELSRLDEQAHIALEYSFALSGQDILFYDDVEEKREKRFDYPAELENAILNNLFAASLDETLGMIDDFFSRIEQAAPDSASCKRMLLRLCLKIGNITDTVAIVSQGESKAGRNPVGEFDPLVQMESFDSLQEVQEWLKDYYSRAYNYLMTMKTNSGRQHMKIREYIEKNYGDSGMNLKKCGEELFLSPNYISSILKKATGKTFVEYLNEVRIARAKELLREPESKVYEVSAMVGFTHPTYFSSVFKKATGLSPREYKEKGS